MTTETPKTFAAVHFKWQKEGDERHYDYIVPDGLTVAADDKVIVNTLHGETVVQVVDVKFASDKATASILRIAPVEPDRLAGEEGGDGDWCNDSDMGAR